jgi:hypothetical protein
MQKCDICGFAIGEQDNNMMMNVKKDVEIMDSYYVIFFYVMNWLHLFNIKLFDANTKSSDMQCCIDIAKQTFNIVKDSTLPHNIIEK